MTPISVLLIPGTFEVLPTDTAMTREKGILAEVTKHLDRNRFRPRWVPYPAKYANGMSYDDSLRACRRAVTDAIARDVYPAIVLGYSQGAQAVGDLMVEIRSAQLRGEQWALDLDIRGVGLIADPSRHEQQAHLIGASQTFGRSVGYGIAGRRLVPTDQYPVWTVAAPGDPITDLPPGNPLRSVADLTRFVVDRDPLSWARSAMAGAQRAQPWWDVGNWSSWGGAIDALRRYLPFDHIANPQGGRHTSYGGSIAPGTNVTYTHRLAQLVSEVKG